MRVAIIGAGISGLTAAHYLTKAGEQGRASRFEVTLFEANHRAGGHTDTHRIEVAGKTVKVDTGFIVFNEYNYPNFTHLLRSLGIAWQDTDMSFSAVNELSGLEYGADGLQRLFAQKRNLFRPGFYRMLRDLLRFYRAAPEVLAEGRTELTLGEYLKTQSYSREFIENHILPMASALWSAPSDTIERFPLHYFIAFMHNHRMLQVEGRPRWKTVCGGSSSYVEQLLKHFSGTLRLGCPVASVRRSHDSVQIESSGFGSESFDKVIFACHSDQALTLLGDPSGAEKDVLGAIAYQENQVVLHSDIRYLPRRRKAWASWNARISDSSDLQCNVSYWMNLLQNLDCEVPLIVTLNPAQSGPMAIDPTQILAQRRYHHPVYTHKTLIAQGRRPAINGVRNSFYCGAYWGWGFHEDGVRSALDCVDLLQQEQQHVAA